MDLISIQRNSCLARESYNLKTVAILTNKVKRRIHSIYVQFKKCNIVLTPTFSHVMSVSLFILFSDHAHQTYFTCNKSCRIIITAMCFKRKISAQKQDFHMKDLDVSVYVCVYEKSRA